MAPVIRSLAPIAAPDARILILGSMPGAASLQAGEYYAHPRNAFWPIMEKLVGAGPEKPYEERTQVLRARGVALWDVLQSCVRSGSLDTDIRDEMPNDFVTFFAEHPRITHIGLNGSKAAGSFAKFVANRCPPDVVVVQLPSTSPAYTKSFAEKYKAWRAALPL